MAHQPIRKIHPTIHRPIKSFSDFWPFYLGEHSKPLTRWFHAGGTLAGLSVAGWFALRGRWWGLLAALALGYAPAWFAHFFIEKNKPATFRHPLWSLAGDFRMLLSLLSGKERGLLRGRPHGKRP